MSVPDISSLSCAELSALRDAVDARLTHLRTDALAELRSRLAAEAQEWGLSVEDIAAQWVRPKQRRTFSRGVSVGVSRGGVLGETES